MLLLVGHVINVNRSLALRFAPVTDMPAQLESSTSLERPEDDVIHQQSSSSAHTQPPPDARSASSSRHKISTVADGSTVPPYSLSLTLQNTGSVARDHLASERTFLAYVRTSLSFASAGVGASLPHHLCFIAF